MRIRDLERSLFERFPREDAESWDHVGLSVGMPDAEMAGICVALDATEANVREAARVGANVLLTHHPVYIKAPDAFAPASPERPVSSAAIFTAAQLGMSILSYHTNLDRSLEARKQLPSLLGLSPISSLEHPDDASTRGLGSLCEVSGALELGELAQSCAGAFSTAPRVWGAPRRSVERVAFLGGSLGSFGEDALAASADVVITGEAGYHVCQDLSLRGLSVILLGHDRSEEPFIDILMDAAIDAGATPSTVRRISGAQQWLTVTDKELA